MIRVKLQAVMRTAFALLFLVKINGSFLKAEEKWIGKCEPMEAIKLIEIELGKGKDIKQAFQEVVKARKFDGSKACITFIREAAMNNMDTYPRTFKALWR